MHGFAHLHGQLAGRHQHEGGRPATRAITLAATTPSPFGPQRHGRPYEPDDDEQDGGAKGEEDKNREKGEGDQKTDGPRTPATRVDAEGLADRIVPFPVEAGRYSGLRAAKGGVLWLRHPLVGTLGSALATPEAQPPGTVRRT